MISLQITNILSIPIEVKTLFGVESGVEYDSLYSSGKVLEVKFTILL